MTNKQIIARLELAGHHVTGNPNRATLEALAAEKGVSLEEGSNSGDGGASDGGASDGGASDGGASDGGAKLLEALVESRGRKIKVRPALDGDGVHAVCEEFPHLVGLGEDAEDAIDELFELIALEPVPPEASAEYDPGQLITPMMAVCSIANDPGAALDLPGAGDTKAETTE